MNTGRYILLGGKIRQCKVAQDVESVAIAHLTSFIKCLHESSYYAIAKLIDDDLIAERTVVRPI